MTKLEAALIYASWGWRVLPVVPNGKLPATQHGVHDATTNPEVIQAWWSRNPDYNLGIAAGEASGIVVFDIDPRNGGEESWDAWTRDNGRVPEGAMQLTAGGGQHYLAVYDETIKSCKLAEGIDLLANGRYFLAYPSTIEGRTYEWEGSSDPIDGVGPFDVPIKWKIAIEARKRTNKTERTTNLASGGFIQGNRNDGLTSMAGYMRRGGMAEAEILSAVVVANETRCEIPLPASEIRQIVQSVCRYEPETDIASDTALGSAAADVLLAPDEPPQDYYLTRATSFLSQPSPISWLVKGWIPAQSTGMIFGEPGVGKTFVMLDIACCIATGTEWHGKRITAGTVVYLAGEGNFGLRQRIASWAKAHDVTNLDNLLISNKAIDMDSPGAAAQILGAVHALTSAPVALVVIDTLNNHMAGDENSAKDTRAMLNACNVVGAALSSTIMLVHHVGHSADKVRARGSSAWRAAVDASIAVMRSKDDESVIEVSCTKMKDAAEPAIMHGKLETVDLGWLDEDNEPMPGAVFAITDAPESTTREKKDSALDKHRKLFENAWWSAGAQVYDGRPFVGRDEMLDYLVSKQGVAEASAKIYIKPSQKGRFICELLLAQIIQSDNKGWTVIDGVQASAMLVRKS